MLLAASAVGALVLILSLGQCAFVSAFVRVLRRRHIENPRYEPKVAVVLSLRGPDPVLTQTLAGLLEQDYPDYAIHLIVDNKDDTVWKEVHAIRDKAPPGLVIASVLRSPRSTCSLKCGALVQAIDDMAPDVEVVAFIDGDAPPHRSWLRQLIAPLADSSIGLSTGNRWYRPQPDNWGGMVRFLWNAGAVVQVWLNGIAWAGSMAMRVETIRRVGLLEQWQHSFSDDGTATRVMRKARLRVHFVPQVIMFNQETTSLAQFHRWVQRQLIHAKSCGPGWRLIPTHALNLVLTQLAVMTTIAVAAMWGDVESVFLCVSSWALYWTTAAVSVVILDREMQLIGEENGVQRPGGRAWMWRSLLSGLVVTHLVYPFSLLSAYGVTRVTWRGIEYEILGDGKVRMLEYRPFQDSRQREVESII